MTKIPSKIVFALLMVSGQSVRAQNFTVEAITTADLGNVASASSGSTTFRTAPVNGAVTKISGSGSRLSSASSRALVTISCGNQPACATSDALVTIAITGTPSNRAGPLQNFTVSTSGATATIASAPGAGSPISFTIGPVGRNSTKTFWVGFDYSIDGDNSGGATGLSSSQFVVTASRTDGARSFSRSGTVQSTVFRSLSVTKIANLAFGTIIRPSSGSGIVSLDSVSGALSISGTGAAALASPVPTRAAFSVVGEGGQSITVFVPPTFIMTGPNGSLTVTTSSNASGATFLSGAAGSAGSLDLLTGGSFPLSSSTPTGAYSGIFSVMVQYN